ncbi:MAG: hypothetical protein WC600_16560 [Desulfobaccales bacterium]
MPDKDKYAYASCKVYQPRPKGIKVLMMAGMEARALRTAGGDACATGTPAPLARAPPCMDLAAVERPSLALPSRSRKANTKMRSNR